MSELISNALKTVTKAVEHDQAGRYAEAYKGYTEAAQQLLIAVQHEQDPRLRQSIAAKVEEYRVRASRLFEFLQRQQPQQQQPQQASTPVAQPQSAPRSGGVPSRATPQLPTQQPPTSQQPPAYTWVQQPQPPAQPSPKEPPTSSQSLPVSTRAGSAERPSAPLSMGTQPRLAQAPIPQLLFNWMATAPQEKLQVTVRKWAFKWDNNVTVPAGQFPFLRCSFSLRVIPNKEQRGLLVEVTDHKLQRYSDQQQKWELPMPISTFKAYFMIDEAGHFIRCLDLAGNAQSGDSFVEKMVFEQTKKQWSHWVGRWIGVSTAEGSPTEGQVLRDGYIKEENRHVSIEVRAEHWSKPCVGLKETREAELDETYGLPSNTVWEAVVETDTLRPHSVSYTHWTGITSPSNSAVAKQQALEKELYVFDWSDLVYSNSSGTTQASVTPHYLDSATYDEAFSEELRKDMKRLGVHMPRDGGNLARGPVGGPSVSNSSNNNDDDDELESDLEEMDPVERAQLEKEFEQFNKDADDSDEDGDESTSPPTTSLPHSQHPHPHPQQQHPQQQQQHSQQPHTTVHSAHSTTATVATAAAPAPATTPVYSMEISNGLLFAELQLLRREMQRMRDDHANEIRLLRTAVLQLAASSSAK
eukprot:TRINITY_DN2431_c4_g1_i1.p1 TRINITY_DN2431_c4_g1~~TRINITY_DN2431_c4_g1_i1.p1  ORF type:complete len:640 (+),score=167.59 TRINITY_DN2431_c4_g1_i1:72-1991(+)